MIIEHRRYGVAECDCFGELHAQNFENGEANDFEAFNNHADFFGVNGTGWDH